MRHCYEFEDDGGVLYWVVARDQDEAKSLIMDADPDAEESISGAWTVRDFTYRADELRKKTLRIDGEDESLSMYLAWVLVRDVGSTVLACSEWP